MIKVEPIISNDLKQEFPGCGVFTASNKLSWDNKDFLANETLYFQEGDAKKIIPALKLAPEETIFPNPRLVAFIKDEDGEIWVLGVEDSGKRFKGKGSIEMSSNKLKWTREFFKNLLGSIPENFMDLSGPSFETTEIPYSVNLVHRVDHDPNRFILVRNYLLVVPDTFSLQV